ALRAGTEDDEYRLSMHVRVLDRFDAGFGPRDERRREPAARDEPEQRDRGERDTPPLLAAQQESDEEKYK
ncbi:TPA: hypothetical protein U2Q01_005090, partial [Burkholderia multivorans]|nr:hypothetical protein [Burkholderia multivorans]